MTRGVPIVSPNATAAEARRLLECNGSHCVLIVDHDDVVGIVYASDLVGAGGDATASSCMHAPVLGICDRASLGEAARLMTDTGLGCLPVFWNNGSLLGLITRQDVSLVC
jgi:CBS domain-containing protein